MFDAYIVIFCILHTRISAFSVSLELLRRELNVTDSTDIDFTIDRYNYDYIRILLLHNRTKEPQAHRIDL